MGDRRANLAGAIHAISELDGVTVEAQSRVFLTEPQEKREQEWFANQVLRIACRADMSPQGLLTSLLNIESSMGRCRKGNAPEDRFGPRIIDIDLLLFGTCEMQTALLTLPHPRMQQRAFVLVPLFDVAPELTFPGGKTLVQALNALTYRVEEDRIWQ